MQNKRIILVLTTIVTLLCLYYLSFTWLSYNVQKKASVYATNQSGHTNFEKKQHYLDSVWQKPVSKWFGQTYTYENLKDRALSLGLDLQGGMHVTLEISPSSIIQALAGDSQNKSFLDALEVANNTYNSQESFIQCFYKAYTKNTKVPLSEIFATSTNRKRIQFTSSDQAVLNMLEQEIKQALNRSFNILRTRIDRFGTSQANIQQLSNSGRIQIEIPGAHNPERVRKLLKGVAKLEFWQVYSLQELQDALSSVNTLLVKEQKTAQLLIKKNSDKPDEAETNDLAKQLSKEDTTKTTNTVHTSPIFSLLKSPYALTYAVADTGKINQIFARKDVAKLLPRNIKLLWDAKASTNKEGLSLLTLHPIKTNIRGKALLEGDVIVHAEQTFDEKGRPAVSMQMNSQGARDWKRITANNLGTCVAIVLDNYVYSAPVINTEIPNGYSQISGNFTIDEAKDLANILKAGSLPAPVKIVEEAIIGPTLGSEAQEKGIFSMFLGLAAIVLFMILYYAKAGTVANIALLFNILFIVGILAQLNASLTLPGIAGIILTIGMSIDANVLIFERIREELAQKIPFKTAIEIGYKKAYSAIIDSNVTTFLIGFILYTLGQGPVRGFATTLMLGIITSFFSAVFITRLIFACTSLKKRVTSMTFSFSYTKNILTNLNINFLAKRRIAYAISSIFILIGLGLTIIQGGFNVGVDFTGGRSYIVAFDRPMEASTLKTQLLHFFDGQGTEVKTYGNNHVMKITTSYLMDNPSTKGDEQVYNTLIKGIENTTKLHFVSTNDIHTLKQGTFTIASTSKVGPTIAQDIKIASQKSIFVSLIIIFLYILCRFRRWQLGLAAIIALLHDSLVVFSAFAIARALGFVYEIDQVFIAAILTVIGYSINDTVVIFDRIRENTKLTTTKNFMQIANKSINETMSRTLITSFTTLLVVALLFIFGGEALKSFSFALLIGIIFGTYSSICIATPLVIDISKKYKIKK